MRSPATSTGRISSSEPNLQDIPTVHGQEGRRIPAAFIADKGNKLVSADYNQIELRVLAHIADIRELERMAADGVDIHAMTASEMFGVPVEGMPSGAPAAPRSVNFRHHLRHLGVRTAIASFPSSSSRRAITSRKYFRRFPGIRDYMDGSKQKARDKGCSSERSLASVSRFALVNPSVRSFNERLDQLHRSRVRLPTISAAP